MAATTEQPVIAASSSADPLLDATIATLVTQAAETAASAVTPQALLTTLDMVANGEEGAPTEAATDDTIKPLEFKVTTRLQPFFTGIDVTSKEEIDKRKKRAQKYGVSEYDPVAVAKGIAPEELAKRNTRADKFGAATKDEEMDLGIDGEEKEGLHLERARRWDVIHCSGTKMLTDMMSTKHILKYFFEYGPTHVEWINDKHCNVVFGDIFSAKRALVAKTVLIKRTLTTEEENQAKEAGITAEDVQLLAWRAAHDSRPEATFILRIAHEEDVKSKITKSDYYRNIRVGEGRGRRSNGRRDSSRRGGGGSGEEDAPEDDDAPGQTPMREVKKLTLSRRAAATPSADGTPLPGDAVALPPADASAEATAAAMAVNLEASAGVLQSGGTGVTRHVLKKRDRAPYARQDETKLQKSIVIGIERTDNGNEVKQIAATLIPADDHRSSASRLARPSGARARPSAVIFRPKIASTPAAAAALLADPTSAAVTEVVPPAPTAPTTEAASLVVATPAVTTEPTAPAIGAPSTADADAIRARRLAKFGGGGAAAAIATKSSIVRLNAAT